MRSVRFMASAMSVASLCFNAGTQNATAVPAGASAAAAGIAGMGDAPFIEVQWGGYGYGYGYGDGYGDPFRSWKHLPGWPAGGYGGAGWGSGWGWDSYGGDPYNYGAGGYRPCCNPRPCCDDPPPPPPPPSPCCRPRPYYAPAPYIPPVYEPLK